MQFGIFDQNDRGLSSLGEQYENRLQLIEFYERAGFRSYHMSEHHATPLNVAPSPSVFLAAIAQRTKRIRFGALVYVLPAHHPLRLAEEICMLDHLSGGRLEVGIGRGASPHELHYFGVDPEQAPAMYVEAYQVIMQALTQDHVDFSGRHYRFDNVPIDLKPAQLPHPPLWYAVPVPDGAAWPAQNAINIVCGGPVARVREITDRYRAEWAAAGNAPEAIPLIGLNRFVVVADTDREAMDLGRRAWPSFLARFMKLWKLHGTQPRFARMPEDFETLVAHGIAVAGSPGSVSDQVRGMMDEAGTTYFISQFSFGDLSHQEVLHSAGLFAREMLAPVREQAAHTPIHPGEHLAEELKELGISAAELSRQIDVPVNRITAIINGQRGVTADTALRLGHWFGTSAEFWLNLQKLYELRLARDEVGDRVAKLPTLTDRRMPSP